MKICVVSPGSGWILDVVARRICQADPEHFVHLPFAEMVQTVDETHVSIVIPTLVDVLYFVDIQSTLPGCMADVCAQRPALVIAGLFTHTDPAANAIWRSHWGTLHGVVHMAQRYYDEWVQAKRLPSERMIVLRPGQPVPVIPLKPLRIGVCQRGGHVGKGKDFLPEVVKRLTPEIRAGLHLVFCGQGWGAAHEENQGCGSYHGIAATYLREAHYQTLYEIVDVFLIPSLYEGGPMALLEALAAGLPVIAADVGWVRDFREDLCRRAGGWPLVGFSIYRPGNVGDLTGLLSIPVQDRLDRRVAVEGMSYKHYAADLLAFCEHLQEVRRG